MASPSDTRRGRRPRVHCLGAKLRSLPDQEAARRAIFGQADRLGIRFYRSAPITGESQKMSACDPVWLMRQGACGRNGIEMRERGLGSGDLRDRNCMADLRAYGRRHRQKSAVEMLDGGPIGFAGQPARYMNGLDGRLVAKATRSPQPAGNAKCALRLRNQCVIPEAGVLIGKRHEVCGRGVAPRFAPRFGEHDKRQKGVGLGIVGGKLYKEAEQPECLFEQIKTALGVNEGEIPAEQIRGARLSSDFRYWSPVSLP
jgi:hypothetical protein